MPFRRFGFTLLELIVVLSILGLATALAAPSLLGTVATWQRRSEVDALFDQLRALPGRARSSGATIVIDEDALASTRSPLRVAEGWTLTTASPWRVRANGVCEGGELTLGDGARTWIVRVSAPFCTPSLSEAVSP